MPAVRLPFRNVGDVHLNHGDADGADAVGEGDGSMGIASRIHHHGIILTVSFLQLVNQDAFMVGLEIGDFVLRKTLAKLRQIVFKGKSAVDFRLTFAEKVKVGTVENEDFHDIAY